MVETACVTDKVKGLILLTANPKAKEEAVNVGNTKEVTTLELAEKVKETTKCKSAIEFHSLPKDDSKRRCPDTARLEMLVGWKPKVGFEEGLK